ncbi:MAG: hypothetical protein EBT86_02425 [Actinobacteria bacterium]|nr:hypothetical protein [Actinomycetota bacterium]
MAFRGVLPARTTQGQYQNRQDYNYNTVYPYGLPLPSTSQIDSLFRGQMNSAVKTADPFLKKVYDNKVQNEFDNLFYPTQLNDQISRLASECRNTDLDTLILKQDKNRSIRCGWLYKPASSTNIPTPRLSQGYLGIRDGPFKFIQPPPAEDAEWFWNLEEAREKILTARCAAMKNCESVGTDMFKSCGYCTGIGQGVPVNAQGRPLYPKNVRTNCSNGSIITNANQCPRETASQQIVGPDGLTEDGKEPDVCALRNGKFSRDCVMSIITTSGCDEGGSLYKTVEQSTNDNDYIEPLRSTTAFRMYNERSPNKLYMNVTTSTKASLENEIQGLATMADDPKYGSESGLGAASRDLCLRQGDINAWDPCNEIPISAKPPYDLNCLQRNFRKLGGQPAGNKYPTEKLKVELYDKMPTYGDVQNYWAGIQERSRSNKYSVQNEAMKELYGINLARTSATVAKVTMGFGDVGDIGYPHISYWLGGNLLFINVNALNNSINKEADNKLNADALFLNVKKGIRYTGIVTNSAGKKVDFDIQDAISINNSAGNRYAIAFRTNRQIKDELDNPSRISVIIF